jgi:pimeloyl-ACP methyl ester carboxylesterase
MNEPPKLEAGVRYVETGPTGGNGACYLLIHGLGGSLEQWSHVLPGLGASARVVAVDVPGFGRSRTARGDFGVEPSVAKLREFCARRRIQDCVLVSHSIGCVIAGRLAALEAARFTRVVLVSGALARAAELAQHPAGFVTRPRLGLVVAIQFAAGVFPVPAGIVGLLAGSRVVRTVALWPFVARPARLRPDVLRDTLRGTGSLAVLRVLLTARRIDYHGIVSSIPQPVELVLGDRDRLINAEDRIRTRRMVRVTRESTIESCGHWPWVEHPERLAELLAAPDAR